MRTYNREFQAEDVNGRPIPGAHVTLWTAQTGGSQITTGIQDLTGVAIPGGLLICDAWGFAPGFQDTADRADIWAIGSDTGAIDNVDRVHLEPNIAAIGQIGGPAGPLDGSGLIPSAQIPGGGGGGGPTLSGTVTAETSYGVSSAAGSAATASRGDHTHGTPSLSSSAATASAVGDAAAAGSATVPARGDHVHGRESFGAATAQTSYGASSGNGSAATPARSDHTHGTPALTSSASGNSAVGDTATVGTATAPARADHVHGREAFGTPGASAVADTAAAGSATTVARSDHRHSRESFGSVTAQTSFGASSGNGAATTLARSDHTHGTPTQDTAEALRQALIPAARIETRSRLDCGVQSSASASGQLLLVPIWLPAGYVVSNITFVSGTTAANGPTHWWFGLYDSSRVQLATTADQTTTAWGTGTAKTLPITTVAGGAGASFTTTYTGLHYLGVMITVTTTMPTLAGAGSLPATVASVSPGFGGADSGLTTPPVFPFTAAAPSGAGLPVYAYTS